MDTKQKLELIKRNTEEIVKEEELVKLLKDKKNPVVYCGYEPNGPVHLGHFVTLTKLMDFEKAGFKVKILIADVHALLNRKGEEKEIEKEVKSWIKTIKAIGLKAEIILASTFQFKEDYVRGVIKLSINTTVKRGTRSMQEIARDIDNATISQAWYPLMQIQDIKELKADVAYGGMEQRKVHMLGRELFKKIGYNFVAVHTPLITSLKGPEIDFPKEILTFQINDTETLQEDIRLKLQNIQYNNDDREFVSTFLYDNEENIIMKKNDEIVRGFKQIKCIDIEKNRVIIQVTIMNIGSKMSKSIPGSFVSVTDTDEQIRRVISTAFCPEKFVIHNPIIEIIKLIIFPRVKGFVIERPTKFGGTLNIKTYYELEKLYSSGKIHPLDLKNSVAEELIKIITPIRKKW